MNDANSLDPITSPIVNTPQRKSSGANEDLLSLVAQLTERLAMERALREQGLVHERDMREAKEVATEKERQTQFNEYERRLDSLNHAHEQAIDAQAKTVPREVFDTYVRETSSRGTLAVAGINEKYDTAIQTMLDRHDRDMVIATSKHESDTKSLEREIQEEREIRKRFEGSINTWRWLVGFLGASGVGGVILLFVTRH